MNRMNLALILQHPAPYRDDFARLLCKETDLNVEVYSLFPSDTAHDFTRDEGGMTSDQFRTIAMRSDPGIKILVCLLRDFVFAKEFDFIMWPGYNKWYVRVALFLCALLRRKYGFTADTAKQKPMNKLLFAIKRYFVQRASIISVVGNAGRRVFEDDFKVESSKIVEGAYSLDVEGIEKKIRSLRDRARAKIRRDMGLANADMLFLMVANMIPSRHYPITSKAFVEFSKTNSNAYYLMVGKGPDTNALIAAAKENPCLKVIPGCSFEEMLSLYAAADVYVHGGTEPASTALVIGAIAHLPLISSPAVGCFYDVVRDRDSGIAVKDYLSVAEWSHAFSGAAANQDRWEDMGAQARALASKFDVRKVVRDFMSALQLAV